MADEKTIDPKRLAREGIAEDEIVRRVAADRRWQEAAAEEFVALELHGGDVRAVDS